MGVIAKLEGHTDSVQDVEWIRNGNALITTGWDGTVRWWSAAGVLERTVDLGPEDWKHCRGRLRRKRPIARDDGHVWVKNARGWVVVDIIADFQPLFAVDWRPDGTRLAVGGSGRFVVIIDPHAPAGD